MKRIVVPLVAVIASTCVMAPSTQAVPAGGSVAPIQPGSYVEVGGRACTLNFIFDGAGSKAGKVYAGTAAQCVTGVGADVTSDTGVSFGVVALVGDPSASATDFALIEIRAASLHNVVGWVRGSPQYPTGVTTPNDTAVGDQVELSGYGLGLDATSETRENRLGFVSYDPFDGFVCGTVPQLHGLPGGTGTPIVHVRTGRAYALVSRISVNGLEGPTVRGVMLQAAARGFPIVLRTT